MPRGNGDEDCGGKSMAPAWRAPEYRGERYRPVPWHFLYFLPDPQGQGSFRPTSGTVAAAGRPTGPSELLTAGAARGAGGGGATARGGRPMKRSSELAGAGCTGAGSGAGPVSRSGGRRGAASRGGSALTWILRKRSVNVDWMSCIRSWNISNASRLYSTSGSF